MCRLEEGIYIIDHDLQGHMSDDGLMEAEYIPLGNGERSSLRVYMYLCCLSPGSAMFLMYADLTFRWLLSNRNKHCFKLII